MEEDNNKGRAGLSPRVGFRYTLEAYRDDRVEANVRRLAMERTSAGAENLAVAPDLTSAASPRRRAVLRETSMPSAFEHVYYNMPETLPQEVVQRRQLARDMADPGLHSDGPRLTDIVHQPPRHATLFHPLAVQRSGRDLLLGRDRAMAADKNLAPLPRPYVPRGLIDADCEPYQDDRGRNKRAALRAQIRSAGADIRQASRVLQQNLGTTIRDVTLRPMELADVQAAADTLRASETDLNIGRNEIIATLLDLQQNWYPQEFVLRMTRINRELLKLAKYPNDGVAQLAKDVFQEWCTTLRVINGNRPTVDGEDPFVNLGADNYGDTIPRQMWENTIRDRQAAARDYNNAASSEIRATNQRRRTDVQRERQDLEDEEVGVHLQRLRSKSNANSSSNTAGAGPIEDGDARGNGRNPDSTITDPGADPAPTGNQDFTIAEINPSLERPQESAGNNVLRQLPEDMPIPTVEVEGPVGLCHACPDFPNTFHHICEGKPPCDKLRAHPRPRTGPNRQERSPNYKPSRSPPPAGQTIDEMIRAATEALARRQERSRATGLSRPVTHPANVPEGMEDPFAGPTRRSQGLGLGNLSGNPVDGSDEVCPSKGRRPQIQRGTTPAVLFSPLLGTSPRPTWADYAASSTPELLNELQGRHTWPVSGAGISKDGLIRMLMTQGASGDGGNGPPGGRPTGVVRDEDQVPPLNLGFSDYTRPGPRAGSQRPSPSNSDGPRISKRLRSSDGPNSV